MPRRSSSRNRVATESERNQFRSRNLVQPRDIMHEISRSELRDAVGSLEDIEGLALAREFLRSQEEALAA